MKQFTSFFGRGLLVAVLTLASVYQGSAIAGANNASATGQANANGNSAIDGAMGGSDGRGHAGDGGGNAGGNSGNKGGGNDNGGGNGPGGGGDNY
jgi:hypothetical protein